MTYEMAETLWTWSSWDTFQPQHDYYGGWDGDKKTCTRTTVKHGFSPTAYGRRPDKTSASGEPSLSCTTTSGEQRTATVVALRHA